MHLTIELRDEVLAALQQLAGAMDPPLRWEAMAARLIEEGLMVAGALSVPDEEGEE